MNEDVKKSLRIVANILKDEIESLEKTKKVSLSDLETQIGNNDLDGALSVIHQLSKYKLTLLENKKAEALRDGNANL